MRTYTVSGMTDERTADAVRQAFEKHYGSGVTVVTDVQAGEVRIDRSADPQVANFLIEGAGCSVVAVGD